MDIQEIQNIVARCTQCKACEQMCSVFLRHGKFAAWEKLQIVKKYCGLNELSDFEIEAVFTCTKCEGCQSVCPENLPLIELFDWARNQFTKKYGFFNSRQPVVVNNIKRSGNPFNQSRSAEIEKISKGHQKHSDILLHLGCLITHRM